MRDGFGDYVLVLSCEKANKINFFSNVGNIIFDVQHIF